MVYIYGDSHARTSFKNLELPCVNKSEPSITMFRVGRDNTIINQTNYHNHDDIVCFTYGEVDCRCHIGRQVESGRDENDVCYELVDNYFRTIKNKVGDYKQIIIVAIIPTTCQEEFEKLNGPITHQFPFVGTDEERVRYTNKINVLLKEFANNNGFIFFDPYDEYKRDNGCLKFELSDTYGHIGENGKIIDLFTNLINNLN